MRLRTAGCLVVLAMTPYRSHAQIPEHSIELFGTAGGVVGVTPVHVLGTGRLGVHGGFLIDAGIQGEQLAVASAFRVWELAPTRVYGGSGLDVMVRAEWRADRGAGTTVRAAAGAGFDAIDGGRGPERQSSGTQGFLWLVGVGRELFAPWGEQLLLSADLVMPHVNSDIDGRRKPIVELGFAYRSRFFRAIRLPSPGRR